ncbi:Kelch repeat-containing protein [Wukongibacter baidiensis]
MDNKSRYAYQKKEFGSCNGKWKNLFDWRPGDHLEDILKVEVYDPKLDTWTSKKDMPTKRPYASVVAVNGKIYVIGGWGRDVKKMVEEYDPETDTWTRKADMPTGRDSPRVAEFDSKIYVIGCWGKGKGVVEVYDPKTNTWIRKKKMLTKKRTLQLVKSNGKLYAFYETFLKNNRVEEYDPAIDTWIGKKDKSPTHRESYSAITVERKIYVIGGEVSSRRRLDTVEEYDPINNIWLY